jgi:16S rRNA processing protein RimM
MVEENQASWLTVGKITSVFGVKGWVKVHSFTQTPVDLFSYKTYRLFNPENHSIQEFNLSSYKAHSKGYIAQLEGCDDRDSAACFQFYEIQIPYDDLPNLIDDYYWYQLKDLLVWNHSEIQPLVCLGRVDSILETGANDVLQVVPTLESMDKKTRLIPYIDNVIVDVCLDKGIINVNWEVDF